MKTKRIPDFGERARRALKQARRVHLGEVPARRHGPAQNAEQLEAELAEVRAQLVALERRSTALERLRRWQARRIRRQEIALGYYRGQVEAGVREHDALALWRGRAMGWMETSQRPLRVIGWLLCPLWAVAGRKPVATQAERRA